MISVDLLNTNGEQYNKLIHYILSNCDKISFHFPGIDYNGEVLNDNFIKEYHQSNSMLIKKCLEHGAKQVISKKYNDMKLGMCSKILYVKPFELIEGMLSKQHLFDWLMQNNYPEDACFYKNGILRFFSCSHDEVFYIYDESQKDVIFLKNNSFNYCKH